MNKEILRLAIPNILSNLSVPLLSSFDTALMGRLTELHIGAVGIGAMVFNFIYWNFGFLRMGTTGITAQAFGREDHKSIIETFGRANVVAIIVAVVILIFQFPIAESFSISDEYFSRTATHCGRILLHKNLGSSRTIALYAFLGWFFWYAKCGLSTDNNHSCQCSQYGVQLFLCNAMGHGSSRRCLGNGNCPIFRSFIGSRIILFINTAIYLNIFSGQFY
jgi:hypothetical protein